MDRNTIIGFVIIMAVLLLFFPLWNHFFPPPVTIPPASTSAPESTQTQSQTPAETLGVTPTTLSAAPPESTIQQAPEKLINIETKHLKIILSSYGGNIRQVILKDYPRGDGKPYSMLGNYSTPEWTRFGALTLGYEDQLLPLNDNSFQVQGDHQTLNPQDSISSVIFTHTMPSGASIIKKFTFHYAEYSYDLKIDINKPRELGFKQGITIGWFSPLEPSERDLNQDKSKLGGYFDMAGDFLNFKGLKNGTMKQAATGPIDWVATKTKYFAAVIIADSAPGAQAMVVGAQSNIADSLGKITKWEQYGIGLTYEHPEADTSLSFTIYTGPLDYDKLRDMGRGLSNLVDFGWHLLRPFAIAIFWLFTTIHKAVPNYGFVLILFAVVMQAIFWPLSLKTIKSTFKMREIQPVLSEIKEKYKNDPAKLNQETMKAYKDYGVNPFSSCLPMLIQLPVFWALYAVLSNTIELRGAPFIFWLQDLSQPDPTGRFLFGIGVLPILMGVTMFIQQKMTITDPKQQMMVYLMPLLFIFLFSRWASGLVLYWTTVSVLGIFQQWYAKRFFDAEKASKRT